MGKTLLMVPVWVEQSEMVDLHKAVRVLGGDKTTHACELLMGQLISAPFLQRDWIDSCLDVVIKSRLGVE